MLNIVAYLAVAFGQTQAVQTLPAAGVFVAGPEAAGTDVATQAQTAFTLDEAIAFGAAHSPMLAAARAHVDAGRARLTSARSWEPLHLDPGVSIGGEEAVAVVTQTIEISGRLRARSAVARHELQVVQKQYEATERDLTRDIRAAYADLVAAQSALVVATDVTDVIRRLRSSIRRQVEVGEIPAQELVKADIELLRAELETVRSQNTLDRATQAFNVTIGRAVELSATASEPITFAHLVAELDVLLEEALRSRPEIAAAQSAVQAAQANVALQRSDFRPDLEISLLQNTDLRSSDFYRAKSTGLSLSLAFPIFDTGRIRGRVREAQAQVRASEFVLAAVRLLVSKDVADAFSRVRTTETLVSVYVDAILPGAQDLLSKAEFGYGRGASTLLEFLEAQRTYRETLLEHLVALADNAKARADLDHAVGRGAVTTTISSLRQTPPRAEAAGESSDPAPFSEKARSKS
ncbi:MAG: TolC family protein [Armatimonadetes bacterium]|nr:TolC family protein [Armatimonadota bacterium]